MARKRRTYKKRRAPRRNPRRRTYRRAASRARATFAGLNIPGALKDVPYAMVGMFGAKWIAKRFGPDADETDPDSWNWSSYLKGGLGAVVAAFLAQMVKKGAGQKVLAGGLNLMFYKLIQNELIAPNAWAAGQFGIEQEADDPYMPDEYTDIDGLGGVEWEDLDGMGAAWDELDGYEPGDVDDDEYGNSYMLGEDENWQALPEVSGMGDVMEPVGPLGDVLTPPGPLGDPVAAALLDA
jgi:hypothetical protein